MALRSNGPRKYSFTLILDGIRAITRDAEDALYGGKCDDALLGMRDGIAFLEFDREATSFEAAVKSAIKDVHTSGCGARVVRVEPDDLVNMSEIARRLGQSRESIRKYVSGERGPGGFPRTVSNVTGRSMQWQWSEVARWFAERDRRQVTSEVRDAITVATLNSVLDVKRRIGSISRLKKLLQEIG